MAPASELVEGRPGHVRAGLSGDRSDDKTAIYAHYLLSCLLFDDVLRMLHGRQLRELGGAGMKRMAAMAIMLAGITMAFGLQGCVFPYHEDDRGHERRDYRDGRGYEREHRDDRGARRDDRRDHRDDRDDYRRDREH